LYEIGTYIVWPLLVLSLHPKMSLYFLLLQLLLPVTILLLAWSAADPMPDSHSGRPVFTHGPMAANFQGWHIKKIEIEVWYAGKKGCPRERNLREIYTENNVGTEFSRYDATGARRS